MSARPRSEPGARSSVLVVTGPSGVGKGTLINALLARRPDLRLSTSATTRAPRPGEVDGRDYHFLTRDEFARRVERGEFLEHATYAGNCYGTLRSELGRADAGIVLEVETEGARQVREVVPSALRVFIAPPSESALRERLERRATDSAAEIENRLSRAREELEAREEFAHVIVNDDVARAADELVALAATIGPLQSPTAGPRPGGATE